MIDMVYLKKIKQMIEIAFEEVDGVEEAKELRDGLVTTIGIEADLQIYRLSQQNKYFFGRVRGWRNIALNYQLNLWELCM